MTLVCFKRLDQILFLYLVNQVPNRPFFSWFKASLKHFFVVVLNWVEKNWNPSLVFIAVSVSAIYTLYVSWWSLSTRLKLREHVKYWAVTTTGIELKSFSKNICSFSQIFLDLKRYLFASCCMWRQKIKKSSQWETAYEHSGKHKTIFFFTKHYLCSFYCQVSKVSTLLVR